MRNLSLKAAREAKGWTQERLAAKAGITQSAISKLERGDVLDPQKSTVDLLEKTLGLKHGTLVFGQREATV